MISTVFLGMTENEEKGTRGQRSWHLHIAIRGFVFKEATKPAYERNLQVPARAARAINAALTRTVSVIACNSRMMMKLLPDIRP
jgi:hypothetical protein